MGEKPITPEECARVASSLRTSIDHYGVKLHPQAVLARMLAAADRVAAAKNPDSDDQEAALLVGQAQHVADCLDGFRNVTDNEGLTKRWLKKNLDRIASPESNALDHLFQIEIAGRLARRNAFSVSTDEPDVVASWPSSTSTPGGTFTIACKHPDSEKGLYDRIVEGAKQIVRAGHIGIVAISADTVLQHGFVTVPRPEAITEWGLRELDRLDRGATAAFKDAFAPDRKLVMGVLLILRAAYLAEVPYSVGYWTMMKSRANPANPAAQQAIRAVTKILFD